MMHVLRKSNEFQRWIDSPEGATSPLSQVERLVGSLQVSIAIVPARHLHTRTLGRRAPAAMDRTEESVPRADGVCPAWQVAEDALSCVRARLEGSSQRENVCASLLRQADKSHALQEAHELGSRTPELTLLVQNLTASVSAIATACLRHLRPATASALARIDAELEGSARTADAALSSLLADEGAARMPARGPTRTPSEQPELGRGSDRWAVHGRGLERGAEAARAHNAHTVHVAHTAPVEPPSERAAAAGALARRQSGGHDAALIGAPPPSTPRATPPLHPRPPSANRVGGERRMAAAGRRRIFHSDSGVALDSPSFGAVPAPTDAGAPADAGAPPALLPMGNAPVPSERRESEETAVAGTQRAGTHRPAGTSLVTSRLRPSVALVPLPAHAPAPPPPPPEAERSHHQPVSLRRSRSRLGERSEWSSSPLEVEPPRAPLAPLCTNVPLSSRHSPPADDLDEVASPLEVRGRG
jgi:hypothetical protein